MTPWKVPCFICSFFFRLSFYLDHDMFNSVRNIQFITKYFVSEGKRIFFNSYSFWRIPFLKAARRPHNLIFKIIFAAMEILGINHSRETSTEYQLAWFWSLPQIMSLRCSQISKANFFVFPPTIQRSLIKQVTLCSQSLCALMEPCKLCYKTHNLSCNEEG